MKRASALLAAAALLGGCFEPLYQSLPDAGQSAVTDAGPGSDAGTDAGNDAGTSQTPFPCNPGQICVEHFATSTLLGIPTGLAANGQGAVYVADWGGYNILAVNASGGVSNYAGLGTNGSANGPAATAQFCQPDGVALDSAGNLYVADSCNNKIRKIDASGNVTTLAGTGSLGAGNGPGGTASFDYPTGVAVDGQGNVFVADQGNHSVRKVDPSGNVSTLSTQFSSPMAVAVDGAGNVFVSDNGGHRILKIDSAGVLTTVAGTGVAGFADGTGGDAGTAQFNGPVGIAYSGGALYVADNNNNRVRKIDAAGNVTTLAGDGSTTDSDGLGGPTGLACIKAPAGIAVADAGLIYVTDGDYSIRAIYSP